ncbi:MAG TPA: FCD domain-containing protein [Ramlibacter sp.]|uniref:GntR family transcriptional regulator n=1 Tax=Ramlibacter sp. TaxID=1917967 RepID=UPI002ED57509
MSAVPPIPTTEGLSRSIAEQIKQLIYAGEFKAGDRINEAALAVRMGTSRGPIREAIRILTGTGLVTPVVNRGVFVRQVSIQEMLEIADLRALVFGFATQRAAENITDAYRRRFEALLDGMDAVAQAGDSGQYYDLNVQFHALILELANHKRAHQLYDSYVKELHLYRRQNFDAPGNMKRSNIEHRKIYDAIAKGNAAKAKQYGQEHIESGRQRLLALTDEK